MAAVAVAAVEELWPKKSLAFNELAWPHHTAQEGRSAASGQTKTETHDCNTTIRGHADTTSVDGEMGG